MAKEKKKDKNGAVLIIGMIVLLLLFAALGYFIRTNMIGIAEDTKIETKILKSELLAINELATYQKEYRETVSKNENKDELFSKCYYATFDGVIKAGVHMDKVVCRVNDPGEE